MERAPEDGRESPRIDVRTLPESVARLWETMLRLDPSWDLSSWLDERALEELELVESHLGRERLRYEQRLHRIENLSKQMRRRRESISGSPSADPKQRNLFDVYEPTEKRESGIDPEAGPLVDLGNLSTDDDLLLAYISQKILIAIEDSNGRGEGLHFDEIIQLLESPGINSEDIDESISWLLQNKDIIEVERDVFVVNG